MKVWVAACAAVGMAWLSGCSSVSELELAEQALNESRGELNATQHELEQIKTSLQILPKDSPPILDLSRRQDLLDRRIGALEKEVEDAETKLAALTQPAVENPPVVPTSPGQPAVDPETGLPTGAPVPTPTPPVPTPPTPEPAPPTPAPTPPTPAPTPPTPAPTPPTPAPTPPTPVPTPPTPVPAAQVPGLRVIQFRVFNNATTGIKYVVGDLGNEATQPHSRIKVEFRLFDANDQLLGTASDTRVTELAPGTVWPFQALIQDAAATRAELAGVTLLP